MTEQEGGKDSKGNADKTDGILLPSLERERDDVSIFKNLPSVCFSPKF